MTPAPKNPKSKATFAEYYEPEELEILKSNPDFKKRAYRDQSGENNSYKRFLDTLSPEQYEKHLEQRRINMAITHTVRTTVNELWNKSVLENNETWNILLQRAAQSVLERAIERGDPQAFTAITDRLLGKVSQTMTINVKESQNEDDILKQIQSMAIQQLSNGEDNDGKKE